MRQGGDVVLGVWGARRGADPAVVRRGDVVVVGGGMALLAAGAAQGRAVGAQGGGLAAPAFVVHAP